VKLSAAFLPIAVTGVMFGPIPAAIVGALGDILSFIIAPTGAYFPGFTINGFITGFIYGMFLYKNNVTPLRVVLAWFTNMLCVETFLIAFWLYTLYGGGSTPYTVYLTARFISVAVKCIPEIILVFALGKLAGKIRVPHAIKRT
ncbi:MAG: folate family ECF transporter S component, partial [Ruminococcus bromii]